MTVIQFQPCGKGARSASDHHCRFIFRRCQVFENLVPANQCVGLVQLTLTLKLMTRLDLMVLEIQHRIKYWLHCLRNVQYFLQRRMNYSSYLSHGLSFTSTPPTGVKYKGPLGISDAETLRISCPMVWTCKACEA